MHEREQTVEHCHMKVNERSSEGEHCICTKVRQHNTADNVVSMLHLTLLRLTLLPTTA